MLGETIVVREKEGTFDKHGYDHDFGVECCLHIDEHTLK